MDEDYQACVRAGAGASEEGRRLKSRLMPSEARLRGLIQPAKAGFATLLGATPVANRFVRWHTVRAAYHQLYAHLVWATWDRLPLITPDIRPRLLAALAAKCQELRCPALAIGAVADHVHVLVELHPTVPVAELVKGLKGSASHLLTHAVAPERPFKWQGSYGAISAGPEGVDALRRYINGQEQHHDQHSLIPAWELPEPPPNAANAPNETLTER